MNIKNINGNYFIHGTQEEATRYLITQDVQVDLIVADPDYKMIGSYLKTDFYDNLRRLIKRKCPMLHFTHNCTGNSPNCIESMPYRFYEEMKKKKFLYQHQIIWQKYNVSNRRYSFRYSHGRRKSCNRIH